MSSRYFLESSSLFNEQNLIFVVADFTKFV